MSDINLDNLVGEEENKEKAETVETVVDESIPKFVPKSIEEELKGKVRSTLFGGYNKGSVKSYVKDIKNNLDNLQVNLEKQIKDLASEKLSLYQECTLLHSQLLENESKVQKLIASEVEAKEKIRELEVANSSLGERNRELLEELEIANSSISNEGKIQELEDYIVSLKEELAIEKDKNLKEEEVVVIEEVVNESLVDVFNKSIDAKESGVLEEIYVQMKKQSDAFLHVIEKMDSDLLRMDTLKNDMYELENKNENLLKDIERLRGDKIEMMDKLSRLAKELI